MTTITIAALRVAGISDDEIVHILEISEELAKDSRRRGRRHPLSDLTQVRKETGNDYH